MVKTFSDLQNIFLRTLDEAGDTGTTLAIAKDYIKSAHDARTSQDWPFMLWPEQITFTTTATRYYPLHQEFSRLCWARNRTTGEFLIETPFRNAQDSGANWDSDTGRASRFLLGSKMPVSTQPSAASALTIVSSSASDTVSRTVVVRGDTADGITTETLTATGTTPVVGTTSFTRILQVTKTGTWVGTLTLSAGATTLLKLFPSEYGRSYTQLEMLNTPDAGDVIAYRFYRTPSVLSHDNDLTDIPPPFEDVLVYDALLLYSGYSSDVSPQSIMVWTAHRDALEKKMQETLIDGQSIGAETRYVHYLGN